MVESPCPDSLGGLGTGDLDGCLGRNQFVIENLPVQFEFALAFRTGKQGGEGARQRSAGFHPKGMLKPMRKTEIAFYHVGEQEGSPGEIEHLKGNGDPNSSLHFATIGRNGKTLHEDSILALSGDQYGVALLPHDVLIGLAHVTTAGKGGLPLFPIDPEGEARNEAVGWKQAIKERDEGTFDWTSNSLFDDTVREDKD